MRSTASTRGTTAAPLARPVRRAVTLVTVTAALALAAAGCGGGDDDSDGAAEAVSPVGAVADTRDTPSITVSGEGRADGKPDLMTLSMGVETNSETANTALDEANVLATALIKTFKDLGVEDKDLQTSELSIWPNWDEDGRSIVGYHVSNSLTVKLRDLERAGEVIDTAAGAVGDAVRFNGVAFSIDDDTGLMAVARADAVEKAAGQAHQLAEAAGVELGDLRSIDETGSAVPTPMYYSGFDESARSAADSVPIEGGTQEVTVEVVLVYDIAQ